MSVALGLLLRAELLVHLFVFFLIIIHCSMQLCLKMYKLQLYVVFPVVCVLTWGKKGPMEMKIYEGSLYKMHNLESSQATFTASVQLSCFFKSQI